MGKTNEPKSDSKGGMMPKSKRNQLLDRLAKEFEKETVLNKLAFARENNINRATVNTLIKELDIQMDSLEVIKLDLKIVFERIKKRLFYLLDQLDEYAIVSGKPDIRAELEVMREIKITYTDFYKLLQQLGEAPTVKESIDLNIGEEKILININVPKQLESGN
tara:strand:+ start:307 stop:795 length:489 start_codon:yes stop_codon:yes gene_type:complete